MLLNIYIYVCMLQCHKLVYINKNIWGGVGVPLGAKYTRIATERIPFSLQQECGSSHPLNLFIFTPWSLKKKQTKTLETHYDPRQRWVKRTLVSKNGTHSCTVHSGIRSGMWPLLRRLQSTSSPKHAHGAGHVRVSAPHPRCSVKTSRKRRKNFTKLPEEHIFPRREQQSNPPIWINLQPQERQSTERWCRGRNKKTNNKENPGCVGSDDPFKSNPECLWWSWPWSLEVKPPSGSGPFPWRNFGAVLRDSALLVGKLVLCGANARVQRRYVRRGGAALGILGNEVQHL